MKLLKKIIGILEVVASAFILISITAAAVVGLEIQNIDRPEHLGNDPQNIAFVKEQTDPNDFTFIVVGDVKTGTATFETMLDVVSQEKPAFAVVLGDFVEQWSLNSHKLFNMEMAEHTQSLPVFLVPGNHDVYEGSGFELKDFQRLYSSEQFSFTLGRCLFVFLNDISPYNETGQYLQFLEQAVSTQPQKPERIFVFMHVPPSDLDSSLMCNGLPGSERFYEICKKYDIDYVFAGDHHGYMKKQKDKTTFIVTGGGGSRLRGKHGRFHHLMRMAVKDNNVTETVLGTPKKVETTELLERNLVNYIWPPISQHPLLTAVIFLFALAVLVRRFYPIFAAKKK